MNIESQEPEKLPYKESTKHKLWSGRVYFGIPATELYTILPQILQEACKVPSAPEQPEREVRISGYAGEATPTTSFYHFTNNTRKAYQDAVREAYASYANDDPYYGYQEALKRIEQIAITNGIPVNQVLEMRGSTSEPLTPDQEIAYRIAWGLNKGSEENASEYPVANLEKKLEPIKDRVTLIPGRIFAYGIKKSTEENIRLLLGTDKNDLNHLYQIGPELNQEIIIVELPKDGLAYIASH